MWAAKSVIRFGFIGSSPAAQLALVSQCQHGAMKGQRGTRRPQPGGMRVSVSGFDPGKKVAELPLDLLDHTLGFVTALEQMLDSLHY
jgi:hypothetical protein